MQRGKGSRTESKLKTVRGRGSKPERVKGITLGFQSSRVATPVPYPSVRETTDITDKGERQGGGGCCDIL